MASPVSLYNQWKKKGILDEKVQIVYEFYSKKITTRTIQSNLGISPRTWMKIKKEPEFKEAIKMGEEELKENLINAIYFRAVGLHLEDSQNQVEESKSGVKKKVNKTRKEALPDWNAARYLLIIKFGRQYNEKKEELDLVRKRLEQGNEQWLLLEDTKKKKE